MLPQQLNSYTKGNASVHGAILLPSRSNDIELELSEV